MLAACGTAGPAPVAAGDGTFANDLAFLQRHVDTIVLTSPTGARVAIVPAYQGRVMTSTPGGERGESLGWIDRDWIAAGGHPVGGDGPGGEDRLDVGPEGGPFALYFAPGSEFTPEHRQPPPPIDREPWRVLARRPDRVVLGERFELTNRVGTRFLVDVRREVALLDPAESLARLGCQLPAGVRAVAFESIHTLTNAGREPWRKDTGLPSIRVVGRFPASAACHVLVPFVAGRERYHGPIVDDGSAFVPADRMRVDEESGLITFRADGRQRARIGVSPRRAKPVLGSWDDARGVLTIVELTLPIDARDYVTSKWREQEDPYGGNVVVVTDGAATGPAGEAPGGQAQGCYELASSSPALALAPADGATHVHRTLHLAGSREQLAGVAREVLGADLAGLRRAD